MISCAVFTDFLFLVVLAVVFCNLHYIVLIAFELICTAFCFYFTVQAPCYLVKQRAILKFESFELLWRRP